MPNESRAQRLSLAGALLSALAASSCCLGPLLLAALGAGGAGAFAAMASLRPYILAVTLALLAAGFYLTYRRPRAAAGDACGCERPRASRAGRVGLWVATALVLLLAASPTLLAKALDRPAKAATSEARTERLTIVVKGVDCQACAVPLRGALAKVGGLHDLALDVPTQTATVTYEPAPGRAEAYVAAIDGLGYEAALRARR
jgi:mercuric ion transport protein